MVKNISQPDSRANSADKQEQLEIENKIYERKHTEKIPNKKKRIKQLGKIKGV